MNEPNIRVELNEILYSYFVLLETDEPDADDEDDEELKLNGSNSDAFKFLFKLNEWVTW